MKQCKVCKQERPLSEFPRSKARKDGHLYTCKECHYQRRAEDYKNKWFVYQARLKKAECKRKGLPYDLTPGYLESVWTDTCPIYGVKFVRFDKSHDHSPALDRIKPELGYTRGNVVYISARANRIKYDTTPDELRLILRFLEGATTIPKGSTLK